MERSIYYDNTKPIDQGIVEKVCIFNNSTNTYKLTTRFVNSIIKMDGGKLSIVLYGNEVSEFVLYLIQDITVENNISRSASRNNSTRISDNDSERSKSLRTRNDKLLNLSNRSNNSGFTKRTPINLTPYKRDDSVRYISSKNRVCRLIIAYKVNNMSLYSFSNENIYCNILPSDTGKYTISTYSIRASDEIDFGFKWKYNDGKYSLLYFNNTELTVGIVLSINSRSKPVAIVTECTGNLTKVYMLSSLASYLCVKKVYIPISNTLKLNNISDIDTKKYEFYRETVINMDIKNTLFTDTITSGMLGNITFITNIL